MAQSVQDVVKIWAAPSMLAVILALATYIFLGQQSRIEGLETQIAEATGSLAVVTTNQDASKEDRQAFQEATTQRLDRMEDLMATMSSAVVRLTTLQEQRDGGG